MTIHGPLFILAFVALFVALFELGMVYELRAYLPLHNLLFNTSMLLAVVFFGTLAMASAVKREVQ